MNLKDFETDDYQKRDGDYPKSKIPVTVQVCDNEIVFSFKNTSESEASKWAKKFAKVNCLDIEECGSCQDGDYHDDWVIASIKVKQ